MAEKTKLKWLRKEFGSSEELEYYLTQLKHQDKLKSDIISLLQRFQHLLFASYEPDFITITYNGDWDVSFGVGTGEDPTRPKDESVNQPKAPPERLKSTKTEKAEPTAKADKGKSKAEAATTKPPSVSKSQLKRSDVKKESVKEKAHKVDKSTGSITGSNRTEAPKHSPRVRVLLQDLMSARLIGAGAKLKHKTQPSIYATITREGNLKIGKEEYQSLSSAATSFASSGRRDGWLCWLFQDEDGDWKPIDLLRERWLNPSAKK